MTNPWSGLTAFVASGVLGATDLNDYVMNNMGHLKSPPLANIITAYTAGTQPVTTATTAVPITAGFSAQLTTYGGPVQVYINGPFAFYNTQPIYNLKIDGTAVTNLVSGLNLPYHIWITGLASGSHTFVPTWQITGGAGASAALLASSRPAVFWVREG